MLMTHPGEQKPHCEPLCSASVVAISAPYFPSSLANPSIVVTYMPSTEQSGRKQELTEA